MSMLLRSAVVSAFLTTTAHAGYIPGSDFSSGNWSGSAFTDDASGEFSHCAISAPYVRGETLYFSVNPFGTVVIGVSNPTWQMTAGQQIDVGIAIDRYSPDYAKADVIDPTMARAILPGEVFQKIRRGHNMRISTVQGYLDFSLAGTARAMNQALECVVFWSERFPPPQVANRVPSTGAAAGVGPVPREDLITLMVNVLSTSGVTGYRMLPANEIPAELAQYPVVWSRDDVIGVLAAYQLEPGETASAFAPKLVSQAAPSCKGEFASGASPGDGQARVFVACREDTASIRVDYTLIQDGGIVYVFGTGTAGTQGSTEAPADPELAESVLRNASLVLNR